MWKPMILKLVRLFIIRINVKTRSKNALLRQRIEEKYKTQRTITLTGKKALLARCVRTANMYKLSRRIDAGGRSYDRSMQISSLRFARPSETFQFDLHSSNLAEEGTHGPTLLASIHHPFGLTSRNRAERTEKSCPSTVHLPLLPSCSYHGSGESMKRILYTWQQYRSTRRQTWISKAFRYAAKPPRYRSRLFINAVVEVSSSRMTNNRLRAPPPPLPTHHAPQSYLPKSLTSSRSSLSEEHLVTQVGAACAFYRTAIKTFGYLPLISCRVAPISKTRSPAVAKSETVIISAVVKKNNTVRYRSNNYIWEKINTTLRIYSARIELIHGGTYFSMQTKGVNQRKISAVCCINAKQILHYVQCVLRYRDIAKSQNIAIRTQRANANEAEKQVR